MIIIILHGGLCFVAIPSSLDLKMFVFFSKVSTHKHMLSLLISPLYSFVFIIPSERFCTLHENIVLVLSTLIRVKSGCECNICML